MPAEQGPDRSRLDRVIAEARRAREEREQSYRERALKLFPWVCGRCARSFTHESLRQLTVHHRDGNHDNNPADGSNWELLCVYCHENEHARVIDSAGRSDPTATGPKAAATHQPFADLAERLRRNR